MGIARQPENEQSALWNGPAGHAWVALQRVLDGMLRPFEDLLVDAVCQEAANHVLDIGCGAGSTTLAIAQRLAPQGDCVGADVSEPLIALARERAEQAGIPAHFIRGDAQTYAFEPASFDVILSRFGVMFFEDPLVAFGNLRRAARAGAALHFVAWRSPADNPFMTTAEQAAAALVPDLPVYRPDAPGQFAFADPHRMERTLASSGWTGIDIRPIDVACTFAEQDLIAYFSRLGPLGRRLSQLEESKRASVVAAVRAAFEPYVYDTEVRFTAACWKVEARAAFAADQATRT